jgi:hypothetical protein
VATLSVQGYFEGFNSLMTGLAGFACGDPMFGKVGLTMAPACSSSSPSTITIFNPYFESLAINGQAGGFSTFSLSMSMPLGPNPLETGDGSVMMIT